MIHQRSRFHTLHSWKMFSYGLRGSAAQTWPSLVPFVGLSHLPWDSLGLWGSGFPSVTLHSFGFCLPACNFLLTLHCLKLSILQA